MRDRLDALHAIVDEVDLGRFGHRSKILPHPILQLCPELVARLYALLQNDKGDWHLALYLVRRSHESSFGSRGMRDDG